MTHNRRLAPWLAACMALAPLTAAYAGPPAPVAVSKAASANPFDVVPWLSFEAPGASLIRQPSAVDLSAKEDQTYITVFGKKKRPDVGPRRDDIYTPVTSEAAIPRDIPIGTPAGCSNGAYNTVAGQPANGQDLVGYLGGGRC